MIRNWGYDDSRGEYVLKSVNTKKTKKKQTKESSLSVDEIIAADRRNPNTQYYDEFTEPHISTAYTEVRNSNGKGYVEVPLHSTALIRPHHVSNGRESIPRHIQRHMEDMDAFRNQKFAEDNDDAGHLLAASLGGLTLKGNFAPMDRRLNRHSNGRPSVWRTVEEKQRKFLTTNRNSSVYWQCGVYYDDPHNRPTGYGVKYTQYKGSKKLGEFENYCSNDPDDDDDYDDDE